MKTEKLFYFNLAMSCVQGKLTIDDVKNILPLSEFGMWYTVYYMPLARMKFIRDQLLIESQLDAYTELLKQFREAANHMSNIVTKYGNILNQLPEADESWPIEKIKAYHAFIEKLMTSQSRIINQYNQWTKQLKEVNLEIEKLNNFIHDTKNYELLAIIGAL